MAQSSAGHGTPEAGPDRPERPGRAGRRGGARHAFRVVVAFLTGVLLTAAAALVLVTLGVLGGDDAGAGPAPAATPGGAASAGSGDVPPSCVQAAEYNETLTTALDEVALGIRDQDARRMQEALDAVQDARPGSEEASRECREAAGQDTSREPAEGDDGADPEPSPTDPSGEPGDGGLPPAEPPATDEPAASPTATP